MKRIREFKGYRTSVVFDPSTQSFAETPESLCFTALDADGGAVPPAQQTKPVAPAPEPERLHKPLRQQAERRKDTARPQHGAMRKRAAQRSA